MASKTPSSLPLLQEALRFLPYVSAYVDLLGLSNRLIALDKISSPRSTPAEQTTLAQAAIRPIEVFRKTFRDYYAAFDRPDTKLSALPSALQAKLKGEVFINTTTLQSLGDAIAISIPLDSDFPVAALRGLLALCAALAVSQTTLLGMQQLIRGGIAIGVSVEAYPGEILGGSLARAVHLEKARPGHPRILVDGLVLQFLDAQSKKGGLAQKLANEVQRHVCVDEDGQHMIDFLCPMVQESLRESSSEENYSALIKAMRAFTRRGLDGDVEYRAKYEWLESYLARRLGP